MEDLRFNMARKKRNIFNTSEQIEELYSETIMDSQDRSPRGIEVEENRIYFYCPVMDREALELNRLLRRLDVEMKYLSDRLGCDPVPIHLHVNSPGGSVFAGVSGQTSASFITLSLSKSN